MPPSSLIVAAAKLQVNTCLLLYSACHSKVDPTLSFSSRVRVCTHPGAAVITSLCAAICFLFFFVCVARDKIAVTVEKKRNTLALNLISWTCW
jgi:hypothetical protein